MKYNTESTNGVTPKDTPAYLRRPDGSSRPVMKMFGEQPTKQYQGVTQESFIAFLQKKRKAAMSNRSAQGIAELDGKNVRVRSSFWDQVVRDIERQIWKVKQDPPNSTYTIELMARVPFSGDKK